MRACPLALIGDGAALPTPVDAEGVVNADLLVEDGKLARIERPAGKRE